MKKIFLLPCLFAAYSVFGQTKLTIQSPNEKCATVFTSNRDFAAGDQGFWAERLNQGGSMYTTIRSFLQFDLSSIPVGSFVNWARLSLFSIGGDGGPNTSLLRRITSAWNPARVTWNTQPITTKRGTERLPMSTTNPENYKNINVTNLVQVMVDSPATSFGFALRLDSDAQGNAARSILFVSPAFGKPHYNPKLVMEYTVPGLQPAVTSMSVDISGLSTEITIYPNPCNGVFNCNIKSASTNNMTLKVIDILGRTVYSQPVNASSLQMRINLPTSSADTYFVILQDENGTIVFEQLQVN